MSLFSLLVADKAGVVFFDPFFCMTIGTIIHFHAVPGIELKTCDVFTPDVNAVTG
jgi:hypothetical protein